MAVFFDRFWKLRLKDREGSFDFTITPDEFGNDLKIQFEINASVDLRYYSGTILVYNFNPDKRRQTVYNQLQSDFGKGPLCQLTAGYKDNNGLIFDGAVLRGFTVRQPNSGNWITTLQVGIPFRENKAVTIEPQYIKDKNRLYDYLRAAVDKILNQPDRIEIAKGPDYETNFKKAIDDYAEAGNTVNEFIGYSGPSQPILNEIQAKYNLKFYKDHSGFNVASGKFKAPTIPAENTTPEIVFNKENGLLGSPIYTDTGAKFFSYLRSDLRMFQFVRVESEVLTKNASIQSLIHRGDSFSEEPNGWVSEMDSSNLTNILKDRV